MTVAKIGLLGGTFDPVHYGHLQLAASALKECRLDKVVFIPAAEPPHKSYASVTSFAHRLAMLTLAIAGIKGFECNPIEGLLAKPSYTIDTLRELQKKYWREYNNDYLLYFMIGADAFLDILSWKSYQEVLYSVHLILSPRKGCKKKQITELLTNIGYKPGDNSWYGDDGKKDIYILKGTPDEQSSSGIRAMIENGQSVQQFLPEPVFDYIQKHKLYQPDNLTIDVFRPV